jgi:cell division protein FtsB
MNMAARKNGKVLTIIMVFILLFLQYRLWYQPGGMRDMWQQKKDLALQIEKNEKMKRINKELLAQIRRSHGNHDAAEFRARQELGMVKKGETFYQVIRREGSLNENLNK